MLVFVILLIAAFWIFCGSVMSTYLYGRNKDMVNDPTLVILFGGLFWPITLIILAGIYVGNCINFK